jgi:hypothetical protein
LVFKPSTLTSDTTSRLKDFLDREKYFVFVARGVTARVPLEELVESAA